MLNLQQLFEGFSAARAYGSRSVKYDVLMEEFAKTLGTLNAKVERLPETRLDMLDDEIRAIQKLVGVDK
jgi:hypothetical protein